MSSGVTWTYPHHKCPESLAHVETNELVDLASCELVSWSTGHLLNNVWSGPKHVVTHEYVGKPNLHWSCGRHPHHKCPESLLQVEGAWSIVIGVDLDRG